MRYFFFSYTFIVKDKSSGNGGIWFVSKGGFPSHKQVMDIIQRQLEKKYTGKFGYSVLGWKEFNSKQDYEDWISED